VASIEEVAECADDLRNVLDTSSLTERKAFIRSFVEEIRISGNDVLMTYSLPICHAR
jgi:site-specific DNA recombinase